jgi:hypothetical protein
MLQTEISSLTDQTEIPTTVEPETLLSSSASQEIAVSFVIPVMNEEENIQPLFDKLSSQLNALGQSYEIIFVDDGSTDKTFLKLKKLHDEHPGVVRVIRFRKNFGKTPALVAGFSRCRGEVIFTMMATCKMTLRRFRISWQSSTKDMILYRAGSSRVLTPSPKRSRRASSMGWSAR